MDLGLFVIRVVVGLLFVGHGAQKLFGAFGGHGLRGTAGFMDSLGMKPGKRHALAAGVAEAGGGALLALGLLTPLAAAAIIAVMVVAVATVHLRNGVWNTNQGYELHLVYVAAAFALATVDGGAWSLDHALGLGLTGAGWGIAALAAGLIGGLGAIASARLASRERGAGRGAHPTAA